MNEVIDAADANGVVVHDLDSDESVFAPVFTPGVLVLPVASVAKDWIVLVSNEGNGMIIWTTASHTGADNATWIELKVDVTGSNTDIEGSFKELSFHSCGIGTIDATPRLRSLTDESAWVVHACTSPLEIWIVTSSHDTLLFLEFPSNCSSAALASIVVVNLAEYLFVGLRASSAVDHLLS